MPNQLREDFPFYKPPEEECEKLGAADRIPETIDEAIEQLELNLTEFSAGIQELQEWGTPEALTAEKDMRTHLLSFLIKERQRVQQLIEQKKKRF